MCSMSPIIGNMLSVAGDAAKSNAATTLMTTNIGFLRAGMVPLDKKTPNDKKAQVAAYLVASTVLSLVTQLSVYKLLGKLVDNISIKNLRLTQFGNEYKTLKNLPLDKIDEAFKQIDTGKISVSKWKAVLSSIKSSGNTAKERELAKQLVKNLDDLALKMTGSSKGLSNKVTTKIIENVKNVKGANQFFMFFFGAALFTGFIIPAFITKYLPNIIQFCHDKTKINGKSIIPEPKKPTNKEKKKKLSNFTLFGIPLLASGGLLAFLNSHKLDLEKGIGNKLHKAFKAVAKWDYNMSPNTRIVRNIFTNAILRPFAAILDGRLFLAVYNFFVETLSAGSLMASKKLLGSAKEGSGLIGKTIKGIEKVGKLTAKQKMGVEFAMTHGIQSFLLLGVILGITTTILSRHITNLAKKVIKTKKDPEKENEIPIKDVFPPAAKLNNNIRSANVANHQVISTQFEEFLAKTGYAQKRNIT